MLDTRKVIPKIKLARACPLQSLQLSDKGQLLTRMQKIRVSRL